MPVRIRFVVGKSAGGERSAAERSRSFASAIARDVAIRASDDAFREVKKAIAASFQRDAKRELTYLMSLYRRHIVGAGATRAQPSGMLRYALEASDTDVGFDDENYAIADSLPAWAPRSPAYLRRKRRQGWSQGWWSARGDLSRGLTADVLLQAYGPIRVSVIRDTRETERVALPGLPGRFAGDRLRTNTEADTHIKLNVATIRVYAMQQITPSMLPALATGVPDTMNSDSPSRGRRFLAPLYAVNPDIYYRLSQTSYNTHRYRPTLEPFLAWYLTRAIPNALALRLQEGALASTRKRTNVVRR